MNNTKRMLCIAILLAGLLIVVSFWRVAVFANKPLLITTDTIYTLTAGTNRTALQSQLENNAIIPKSIWFPVLLRFNPSLAKVKAGTYRLQPTMTVKSLLRLLVSGKEAQFPLRLVEGQTIAEWLVMLRTAPYLKHTLSNDSPKTLAETLQLPPNSLEGQFYPDTWLYTANTTDVAMLKKSYQRMQTELMNQWQQRAANLPYQNPQQLLTLASIIEKETGIASERAEVASVFINRMRQGMRLQTDPTVIYGLGKAYDGKLTREALAQYTPYNTYLITGLPPTPIAMPSQASLIAAAHPATTDYLYFVANGTGGHTFSKNLAEHNQAVRYWRQLEKKSSIAGKTQSNQPEHVK
jgi:UPF0755 protein